MVFIKKRLFLAVGTIIAFLSLITLVLASQGIIAKDFASLYFGAGSYYFNNGDYEKAIYLFDKVIAENPNAVEGYHNLGISYYHLGNSQKALEHLHSSVAINANYAKGHYSLGLIYYHSGDYGSAIKHFKQTVELQPDNADSHYDLAIALVDYFRAKEDSGKIETADLELLREAYSLFTEAEELQHGFPNAVNNANVVLGVLEYYS